MKQIVAILVVIAAGWSASVRAANTPSEKPGGWRLVHVFCAEFSRGPASTPEEESKQWTRLVSRLETRARDAAPFPKNVAEFMNCIKKHSAEFEEGEFLFEGRELVRQTLRTMEKAESRKGGEPLHLATPQIAVPMLGSYPMPNAPSEGKKDDVLVLREREEHYRALWESFLDRIRQRMPRRTESPVRGR